MKTFAAVAASLFVVFILGASCGAQVQLSQDFDSGSLNVAQSWVSGGQVYLEPRRTIPQYHGYRWVNFEAAGVKDASLTFHISNSDFIGSLEGHRYVYSYDDQTWNFFDHGVINGDTYTFFNDTPFSENNVHIAYGLPYPVQRTMDLVQELSTSPFVVPSPSGNDDFIIGHSVSTIDELGRQVPPQPLYGLRITDPSVTQAKSRIMLASGSHSGETTGDYVFEGFLRFITGDSPVATSLRSMAEFLVYPEVNPAGRFAGYYRSGPENPGIDFNRSYNHPEGFSDLTAVTQAMRFDSAAEVDYLFDFHSWWGPWRGKNHVITQPEMQDSDFLTDAFRNRPDLGISISTGHPGMLRVWGASPQGLQAEYAYTFEIGFHPEVYESDLQELGSSLAMALYDTLGQTTPTRLCDLDGDGQCNGADLDLLLHTASGPTPSVDPRLDFNGDGFVLTDARRLHSDTDWYLTHLARTQYGDTNLDGAVDFEDYLTFRQSYGKAGGWSAGNFDGDEFVNFRDFLALSRNYGFHRDVLARTVPEPTGCLLLFSAGVCLVPRPMTQKGAGRSGLNSRKETRT